MGYKIGGKVKCIEVNQPFFGAEGKEYTVRAINLLLEEMPERYPAPVSSVRFAPSDKASYNQAVKDVVKVLESCLNEDNGKNSASDTLLKSLTKRIRRLRK